MGLVLDGELVAFSDDGKPSFPLLSRRMLHRDWSIRVRLMIFDVLRVDGHNVTCNAYAQRRALLEELDLTGWAQETPDVFVMELHFGKRRSNSAWRESS